MCLVPKCVFVNFEKAGRMEPPSGVLMQRGFNDYVKVPPACEGDMGLYWVNHHLLCFNCKQLIVKTTIFEMSAKRPFSIFEDQ